VNDSPAASQTRARPASFRDVNCQSVSRPKIPPPAIRSRTRSGGDSGAVPPPFRSLAIRRHRRLVHAL